MGKPGKKVKTGGKHRLARKTYTSTPKSPRNQRRGTSYEEESDVPVFTLRDAARTTGIEPRPFTANLRHQKIGFVPASHAPLNDPSEIESPDDASKRENVSKEQPPGLAESHEDTSNAATKKLVISGLHAASTEVDLLNLAEAHGEVQWCEIVRNQEGECVGYGKITMRTAQEAHSLRLALDGELHNGTTLTVDLDKSMSSAMDIMEDAVPKSVGSLNNTPVIIPSADSTATSNACVETTPQATDSEDEVVFVGRKHNANRKDTSKPRTNQLQRVSPAPVSSTIQSAPHPLRSDIRTPERRKDQARPKQPKPNIIVPVPENKVTVIRQSAPQLADSLFSHKNAVEVALDDYMSNVQLNGEENAVNNHRVSPNRPQESDNDWTATDLDDFDDLSTSDADVHGIEAVLKKRQRPAGTQYLVVLEGQTIDEARWIHQEALDVEGAVELIQAFENEEKLVQQFLDEDNDDDGPELDDSDDDDDDEEFADERDLYERKLSRMTDERIARLLAKQEELGMGSDELLLFDDLPDDAPDDDMDFDQDFLAFDDKAQSKKRAKGEGRAALNHDTVDMFEEDELFGAPSGHGNGYGDFDIMDLERPSLKAARTQKNLPDLSFVSDSDLEATLRETWEADRRKKKAKKAERDDLRAAGLLGSKGRPNKFKPDVNVTGVDLEDLKLRLETFLMDDEDQQLALPPMDKRDRKIIHEISGVFGLKSKSAGSGRGRFPVLFKTSKTPSDFDERLFARLNTQMERRFLPRTDRRTTTYRGSGLRRGGGGGRMAGTMYLEGETVGAGAAELGVGNRGHAMLEKMGWSKGMVLGALGNDRGILQPIEHVVKKSRTGLG